MSMDMSMSMPSSTAMSMASSVVSSAMPSSTAMGGMDMGGGEDSGMDMMGGCKISMLWNWYTVDACFISDSWKITSKGMFAGSCIGIILLVMTLEALRRASREYDAYIVRSKVKALGTSSPARTDSDSDRNKDPLVQSSASAVPQGPTNFKPSLFQQLVRALLHMAQFAVAYFVMLMAMYYNGYIIISILIGAFVGSFVFSWQSMAMPSEQREITYCCG